MNDRKCIGTGATGTIIAAICCFTPALVIGLGAIGLSAWLVWADYVLFPALALFAALTAYGIYLRYRRSQRSGGAGEPDSSRTTTAREAGAR